MIEKLRNELSKKGYCYYNNSDFGLEIHFPLYSLIVNETLSDKLHVRKEDTNGNKLEGKVYKTVNGVINYIKRNISNI